MLTAAEAKELLALVKGLDGHVVGHGLEFDRLTDLATRVAHDYEVMEISLELTEKCEELRNYTNKTVPPELSARIRELAEHLARIDPEEPEEL